MHHTGFEKVDEQLLLDCKMGNRSRQRELYGLISSDLYAFCMQNCKDSKAAEQFLITAFVSIINNLDSYGQGGDFRKWCYEILVSGFVQQEMY